MPCRDSNQLMKTRTRPLTFPLTVTALTLVLATSACGPQIQVSTRNGAAGVSRNSREGVSVERTRSGAVNAAIRKVEVDNQFGEVRVDGQSESLGWEWRLQCWGVDSETADRMADLVTLHATELDGTLKIRLELPENPPDDWRGVLSDLTLRAPKSVAVQVSNGFGPTSIRDIEGDTEANCQHSDLAVERIEGRVKARTSFARLNASDIGPGELTNQNGPLKVVGVRGDLECRTSFDLLTAHGVEGVLKGRNQNGGIDAENVTGDAELKTSFDGIRVANIGGRVELENQNGSVNASDIGGAANCRTSFDTLKIARVEGEVLARNQNGKIEVESVRGNADLKTTFDAIQLRGTRGDVVAVNQNGAIRGDEIDGNVTAETSFDKIELTVRGQETRCKNQNGDIRITTVGDALRKLEAETRFGSLDITLPRNLAPHIRAATRFGEVKSDFPISTGPGEDGTAPADSAPTVTLEAANGDIRIRKAR